MILLSSNKNKIREFKRIIGEELEIKEGPDLKEVMGDMNEVILYKSLDSGAGVIVEDTILTIDGKEVVDIKWNQEDKLKDAKKAQWIVSLGYNDGNSISVYRGIINGIIVKPNSDGFGFDPYFLPDGSDITLAELEKEGKKDLFSARIKALINLKNNHTILKKDLKEIPKWDGKYQNS